jgi:hypothetical protein
MSVAEMKKIIQYQVEQNDDENALQQVLIILNKRQNSGENIDATKIDATTFC